MNDTDHWDEALAHADDPEALEPHDFDDSAAWAQMTAFHWHLVRSLDDLRIETASPELFKEGTAFACSRVLQKTADPALAERARWPSSFSLASEIWSQSRSALTRCC